MKALKKQRQVWLKAAVGAALEAGKILKKGFHTKLDIKKKRDAGLVTQFDVAAEQAIIKRLMKATPTFRMLGEESGETQAKELDLKDQGRWVIDPLDGTTNFVHRFPMFCVSIGLEVDGELQVGVIYHPILDDLYFAVKDGGAFVKHSSKKPVRMKVSSTKKIDDSLFTTGFTYVKNRSGLLSAEMRAFQNMSEKARGIRRPGSAALDLAYVARGVFDGFWERNLSPWDIAAGVLLVQEAGGTVTSFSLENSKGPRKTFNISDREIIAANSALHRQILSRVK